jgi:hypothetical protein
MWKTYFKFVKLEPGRVVTTLFGELDFSADDIGIEIIKALYETGFPYLEITEEGKVKFYPVVSEMENTEIISKPNREKSRNSSISSILTN